MQKLFPRVPSDEMLDADPEALFAYFETRSKQMLMDGFVWSRTIRELDGCPWTTFRRGADEFCSIYVPSPLVGRGLLKSVHLQIGLPVATIDACSIVPALERLGIPHAVAGRPILQSPEYLMIERHYGDQRAARSGVFLQNHIDEGLAVMKAWGASDLAMRAFCLHPMIQADCDFNARHEVLAEELSANPSAAQALELAVEYRRVANAYLSNASLPDAGIALSPMKDVNDMLVGDKIQNRKDFLLHHSGAGSKPAHPRAARLAEYFEQWIDALGASSREAELSALISGAPTPPSLLARLGQP